MIDDAARRTWETYTAAWNARSEEDKRAALKVSCQEVCVYRDPLTEAHGHDALVAAMLDFHRQVPGGHFETTEFHAHHGRSVARWTMRGGDGAALGEGISYGEYGAHGKLVAMAGFFETRRP
ncbi:MAG TPA: nuclear transport factor 2 family protein [Polyangiaceae bacterium]|jgi:hypothetical protein